MDTKKELDEIVLKLARIDLQDRNPNRLILKAKAVGAVAEWLRAERDNNYYRPRLAPL